MARTNDRANAYEIPSWAIAMTLYGGASRREENNSMSYHEDPAINDTVLSIVNDGNGDFCGYDYKQRCDITGYDDARSLFREMARNYSYVRRHRFGARRLTKEQWHTAGDLLLNYYQNHVKEMAS